MNDTGRPAPAHGPLPNPDVDLEALARVSFSAVFSDICDRLGLREQTGHPGLLPLTGSGTFIGWARTAVSRPVAAAPAVPYAAEVAFIDSLRTGDLAVVDCSEAPVAVWGELFSAASKGRGAVGAVIDGYIRDQTRIHDLGFPILARGCRPTDSLGRISIGETDAPVRIAGVPVRSGDLVVADPDGFTVVPRAHATEAIGLAIEKASTESKALDLLLKGGTLGTVWERFRVL